MPPQELSQDDTRAGPASLSSGVVYDLDGRAIPGALATGPAAQTLLARKVSGMNGGVLPSAASAGRQTASRSVTPATPPQAAGAPAGTSPTAQVNGNAAAPQQPAASHSAEPAEGSDGSGAGPSTTAAPAESSGALGLSAAVGMTQPPPSCAAFSARQLDATTLEVLGAGLRDASEITPHIAAAYDMFGEALLASLPYGPLAQVFV